MKKLTGIIAVILALLTAFPFSAYAFSESKTAENLSAWLKENVSVSDAETNTDSQLDWTVFALARSGINDLNENYKQYIVESVEKNYSNLYLSDLARIALAVQAIGMDPSDIGGKDLTASIAEYDYSSEAYTGSIAYALIVLEGCGKKYEKSVSELKSLLLSAQRNDGGFNSYLKADTEMFWTLDGEADSTGIVLQAAALFAGEEEFGLLINRALEFIKQNQLESGGFGAWGSESAESTAMIICGLCELGIDPLGADFTKGENNTLSSLEKFINEDGGGRCYDGSSNIMTSYQMLMALNSYYRFGNKKVGLFDLSCLSPYCVSIEHSNFAAKAPFIAKLICGLIRVISRLFGLSYYCCMH